MPKAMFYLKRRFIQNMLIWFSIFWYFMKIYIFLLKNLLIYFCVSLVSGTFHWYNDSFQDFCMFPGYVLETPLIHRQFPGLFCIFQGIKSNCHTVFFLVKLFRNVEKNTTKLKGCRRRRCESQ